MIDPLEARQLLSVTVTYDSDGQILRFVGNDKRDNIEFARADDVLTLSVVVNGVSQDFSQPITLISIDTGDGADTIILGKQTIPAFIRGGKGADSISGGDGADT